MVLNASPHNELYSCFEYTNSGHSSPVTFTSSIVSSIQKHHLYPPPIAQSQAYCRNVRYTEETFKSDFVNDCNVTLAPAALAFETPALAAIHPPSPSRCRSSSLGTACILLSFDRCQGVTRCGHLGRINLTPLCTTSCDFSLDVFVVVDVSDLPLP